MAKLEVEKAEIINELINIEEEFNLNPKFIKDANIWIKKQSKKYQNIFYEIGIEWYDATIIAAYTGFIAKSLNHYLRKKEKDIKYKSSFDDYFNNDSEYKQFDYNHFYELISKSLSSSLNKLKSLNNITVYRVESNIEIKERCAWFRKNIGNFLMYNFYVSTSQKQINKEDHLHFIIKSKINNSGLKDLVPIMDYIDKDRNKIEMEALFQINSFFQITNVKVINEKKCVVSLQEVDKPNDKFTTTFNSYWKN